jgi:hypothetical protein
MDSADGRHSVDGVLLSAVQSTLPKTEPAKEKKSRQVAAIALLAILFLCQPSNASSIQNDSINVAADQGLVAQVDGPLNQLEIKSFVVLLTRKAKGECSVPLRDRGSCSIGLPAVQKLLHYDGIAQKITLVGLPRLDRPDDNIVPFRSSNRHDFYDVDKQVAQSIPARESSIDDLYIGRERTRSNVGSRLEETFFSRRPIVSSKRCQGIFSALEPPELDRSCGEDMRIDDVLHASPVVVGVASQSRRNKDSVVFKCGKLTIVVHVRTVILGDSTVGGEYNFVLHDISKSDRTLKAAFHAGKCICASKNAAANNRELDRSFHLALGSDGRSSVLNSGSTSEIYGENVFIGLSRHRWKELVLLSGINRIQASKRESEVMGLNRLPLLKHFASEVPLGINLYETHTVRSVVQGRAVEGWAVEKTSNEFGSDKGPVKLREVPNIVFNRISGDADHLLLCKSCVGEYGQTVCRDIFVVIAQLIAGQDVTGGCITKSHQSVIDGDYASWRVIGISQSEQNWQMAAINVEGQRSINLEIYVNPWTLIQFQLARSRIGRTLGSVGRLLIGFIHLDCVNGVEKESQKQRRLDAMSEPLVKLKIVPSLATVLPESADFDSDSSHAFFKFVVGIFLLWLGLFAFWIMCVHAYLTRGRIAICSAIAIIGILLIHDFLMA